MVKSHVCEQIQELNSLKTQTYFIEQKGDYSETWKYEGLEEEPLFWYFTIVSYANELAVRDGQAIYVGEELSRIEVVINYCPFCGMKLFN